MNRYRGTTWLIAGLLGIFWGQASARAMAEDPLFQHFQLETDFADWGSNKREVTWDGFGWYGGDLEKVWFKTEGEWSDGDLEEAELQVLYSRNIDRFWDIQTGLRHDFQSTPTNYLVLALSGLAPYFFETEASLFVSDEGDVSFRGELEYDLLLTQTIILSPYVEATLFARDVPEHDVGAGLSSIDSGIKLRYEIAREFSPYIDLNYAGLFGETRSIAEAHNSDANDVTLRIGIQFWLN